MIYFEMKLTPVLVHLQMSSVMPHQLKFNSKCCGVLQLLSEQCDVSFLELSDQQIKVQQSIYWHDFEYINTNYEVKQLNAFGKIKMPR